MFAAIKTLISKWLRPKSSELKNQPVTQPDTSSNSIAQDDLVQSFNHVSQHDGETHFSDLVPYDENLLERSRTQWQFGDWESLAGLSRETLQHHPDRAKLALLAAAGKMQINQMSEARQLIQLAQDWGVSRKLVTQILASGVHNSLACAASLAGKQDRASLHFESAIALGAPGADRKLLVRARLNEQLQHLNLSTDVTTELTAQVWNPVGFNVSSLVQGIHSLNQALTQQKGELDGRFKIQADEIIRARKYLDIHIKREVANVARQIEATIGLQSYFATGELPCVNSERHNMPISPDFSLYLIELLELNDYDIIVEFGSGISTVIIAKTIAKRAKMRKGRQPVEFISFEHLEKYYQRTCDLLRQAGLRNTVDVQLSPLQDWKGADGVFQPYYRCESNVEALAQKYDVRHVNLLVIVDGPPAATGRHARYPAGPIILKYFSKARQLDILLDDYIRDEEKEIAERWQVELAAANISFESEIRSLEKDACLIRIEQPPSEFAT